MLVLLLGLSLVGACAAEEEGFEQEPGGAEAEEPDNGDDVVQEEEEPVEEEPEEEVEEESRFGIKRFEVASYAHPCTGLEVRSCRLVRKEGNEDFSFLYDPIDGARLEIGYKYELDVNVIEVVDPLEDASSVRYELVEMLSEVRDEEPFTVTVRSPSYVEFRDGEPFVVAVRTPECVTEAVCEEFEAAIEALQSSGTRFELVLRHPEVYPGALILEEVRPFEP